MKDHPAVIECTVEPVSHAAIECAAKIIPYKGPEDSGRLKVTRLDAKNRPNPIGDRWHLALQVRPKEVEEWFDSYVCRCEAWNKVFALQRPKKVVSRAAIVVEAYMEEQFQVEPVSTDLAVGSRLTLTCVPPRGRPEPETYWLFNGAKVPSEAHARILVDDYNQLIIENVSLESSGNYSCVADLLSKEFRYATATVNIVPIWKTKPPKTDSWMKWTPCAWHTEVAPEPFGVLRRFCQSRRVRTCAYGLSLDVDQLQRDTSSRSLDERLKKCPLPWLQKKNCSSKDCKGKNISLTQTTETHEDENSVLRTDSQARLIATICGLFLCLALFIGIIGVTASKRTRLVLKSYQCVWGCCCSQDTSRRSKPTCPGGTLIKDSLLCTADAISGTSVVNSRTLQERIRNQSSDFVQNDSIPFKLPHYLMTARSDIQFVRNDLEVKTASTGSSTEQSSDTATTNLTTMDLAFESQGNAMQEATNPPVPENSLLGFVDVTTHPGIPCQIQLKQKPSLCCEVEKDTTGLIKPLSLVVRESVPEDGCTLSIGKSGIYLRVPPHVFEHTKETEVYLAVFKDRKDQPTLQPHQILLSETIEFGPTNVRFLKPVELTFGHYLAHSPAVSQLFICFAIPNVKSDSINWQVQPMLSEFSGVQLSLRILDGTTARLTSTSPVRICLIGQLQNTIVSCDFYENDHTEYLQIGCNETKEKILHFTAFGSWTTVEKYYNIRVHVLSGKVDELEQMVRLERDLNGQFLVGAGPIQFKNCGANLIFCIENIGGGWHSRLHSGKQEIPFRHVWNRDQSALLHCSFTLEYLGPAYVGGCCTITVHQEGVYDQHAALCVQRVT
ncbi:unnamed protein product [Dicrocoelium dendriticum]|nr:unnamed protein product [Dicrocoelium dendriticum]